MNVEKIALGNMKRNYSHELRAVGSVTKVVVLMETTPLSDEFVQVALTQEDYIQLLNFLEAHMPHEKDGTFRVLANDTYTYKLKDIPTDYTTGEMVKMKRDIVGARREDDWDKG